MMQPKSLCSSNLFIGSYISNAPKKAMYIQCVVVVVGGGVLVEEAAQRQDDKVARKETGRQQ
jgi:hypothetical protein